MPRLLLLPCRGEPLKDPSVAVHEVIELSWQGADGGDGGRRHEAPATSPDPERPQPHSMTTIKWIVIGVVAVAVVVLGLF